MPEVSLLLSCLLFSHNSLTHHRPRRFRMATLPRQWRDIAFCLSLLPYKSERSVKRLMEGLPFYQDKLHDQGVFESFTAIVAKARQKPVGQAAATANSNEGDLAEFEQVSALPWSLVSCRCCS